MDFIDLAQNHLIFETDTLDNMDCEGRSALIQLFGKVSNNTEKDRLSKLINVIKAIICKGGNIYQENPEGEKAIEFCFSHSVREEIEKFQKDQNVKEKIIDRVNVVVREKINCGICFDKEVDSAFECGHTVCKICGDQIVRCPYCNLEPVRARRIYFS